MCQAMNERVVIAGRAASPNVAEQHHQAGQEAGRGREADQGFEEQRHRITPAKQGPDRTRS